MTHDSVPGMPTYEHPALAAATLRWRCDPEPFDFESTHDVEPIEGVVGQDSAVEALRFGLEVNAPGQNIFVRGLTGTGRTTLAQEPARVHPAECRRAPDRAYVHNFEAPGPPAAAHPAARRGIRLPARRGRLLAVRPRRSCRPALGSDVVRGRIAEIDRETQRAIEAVGEPFDEELREAGPDPGAGRRSAPTRAR